MFLGDPPGNHDRMLDFSAAVTGTLFFVPTAGFLEGLPPETASTAPQVEDTHNPRPRRPTDRWGSAASGRARPEHRRVLPRRRCEDGPWPNRPMAIGP